MRDPISCVKHFATSLAANPSYTLQTTAHGLAHVGELEGPLKYLAPIQVGVGLLSTFGSAVSGNPVGVAIGGVATTHGAAILFEHGENVRAKAAGEKPPEPPPPV